MAMLPTGGVIYAQETNNKQAIHILYDEVLNKKNLDLLKDIVSPDFTGPKGEKGVAGFEAPVLPLLNAFSGIQWQVEDIIAEGDKVFVRSKWHGVHTATFNNIPPTGKEVTTESMSIYEFKAGKIIASYVLPDRVGFMQQLGILPLDLTTLPVKKTP
jgi:predicted ester cyclase